MARGIEKAGGVTDVAVRGKTGRSWAEWFALLDDAGCAGMDHKGIVAVVAQHGATSWWQQMITVAYEQSRGLRKKHETTAGYQIGVSRTLNVSPEDAFAFWDNARSRKAWLGEIPLEVRAAVEPKVLRGTVEEGRAVEVRFTDKGKKGAAKTQVTVQVTKIAGPRAAAAEKKRWGAALDALQERASS